VYRFRLRIRSGRSRPRPRKRRKDRSHSVPSDRLSNRSRSRLCRTRSCRFGISAAELCEVPATPRAQVCAPAATPSPQRNERPGGVSSSQPRLLAVESECQSTVGEGGAVPTRPSADRSQGSVAVHPPRGGWVMGQRRHGPQRPLRRFTDVFSVGCRGLLRVPGRLVISVGADAESGTRLQGVRLLARLAARSVVPPGVLPVRMRAA